AADRDRIAAVLLGAAIPAAVIGPALHEQPGDRRARVAQQQRGDRGIHPARHADDDLRTAPPMFCSSDSGWRLPARWSATTCQTSGLRWRADSARSSEGAS